MLTRTATALTLLVVLAVASPLGAQPLDPAASEALATTIKTLMDPTQRSAAIANSPQAAPIDQQIRSDFDSSSPGATHGGFGGIAVLLLLAAFIVFNLVIVIRRSRGRSLPPPETLHQVH